MSLSFVQGDTAPDIASVIHDEDAPASPKNLSTATGVRFQMRKSDDRRYTVNAAAIVVNATLGQVKYQWGANDLAVPGTYDVQWEVTWSGGRIQTTTPPEEIEVRRQ